MSDNAANNIQNFVPGYYQQTDESCKFGFSDNNLQNLQNNKNFVSNLNYSPNNNFCPDFTQQESECQQNNPDFPLDFEYQAATDQSFVDYFDGKSDFLYQIDPQFNSVNDLAQTSNSQQNLSYENQGEFLTPTYYQPKHEEVKEKDFVGDLRD